MRIGHGRTRGRHDTSSTLAEEDVLGVADDGLPRTGCRAMRRAARPLAGVGATATTSSTATGGSPTASTTRRSPGSPPTSSSRASRKATGSRSSARTRSSGSSRSGRPCRSARSRSGSTSGGRRTSSTTRSPTARRSSSSTTWRRSPPLLDGPDAVDARQSQIDEDDPALILYTSGTTGRPEGRDALAPQPDLPGAGAAAR